MDDHKWERRGSWGGILTAILTIVVFALPGEPAKTSASSREIAQYVRDEGDEQRWATYVGALAVIALLWWLGSVWRLIRRAEGGTPRLAVVATAGGVVAAVLILVSGVILAAIPITGADLSPTGQRAFYVIGTNLGMATVFGFATFVGAFSVVIIRSRVLPVWLGWAGVLIAVIGAFGGGTVTSTRHVFFYTSFVAFMGLVLWILVVSILMVRGAGAEVNSAVAAPPSSSSATSSATSRSGLAPSRSTRRYLRVQLRSTHGREPRTQSALHFQVGPPRRSPVGADSSGTGCYTSRVLRDP